jgi:hypothetical protein
LTLPFSRKIVSCDYDPDNSILTIVFKAGIVRKYSGIPQKVYNALTNANDTEYFYEREIDGKYTIV